MNISYHKLPTGILVTIIDEQNDFVYDCLIEEPIR